MINELPGWFQDITVGSVLLLCGILIATLSIIRTIRGLFAPIVSALELSTVVAKLVPQLTQLLEDFNGDPDRPGLPGRRSIPVRLETVENDLRAISAGQRAQGVILERVASDINQLRSRYISEEDDPHA